MSLPAYPSYKDSGSPWVGRLPAHWEDRPLKRSLRLLTEKTDRRHHPIGLENIEGWSGRFLVTDTEFDGEGVAFEAGDLLFGKLRPYLAKVYLAQKAGEAVGDFHVMHPLPGIVSRFAFYQLLNRDFIGVVDGSTFGAKMPRVSWDFMASLPMAVPPEEEQCAVAAFLDRETGKIDALVAEQEKLIALLKEQRDTIISHAVTKGLDSSVTLKPSGVEWLGDVPAHWAVSTLSRIAQRVVVGIAEAATHAYSDTGIPILRSTNIRAGRIVGELLFINSTFSDGRSSKLINACDLVTVRTGNAGVTAVVPAELDGCQCFTMLITTLNIGFDSAFFCYWMNSSPAQRYFSLEGWGTAQVNISVPILKMLPVPIPQKQEQLGIVAHLDSELEKLDRLSAESGRAIKLLEERRAALISAAVTGRIDVRGLT